MATSEPGIQPRPTDRADPQSRSQDLSRFLWGTDSGNSPGRSGFALRYCIRQDHGNLHPLVPKPFVDPQTGDGVVIHKSEIDLRDLNSVGDASEKLRLADIRIHSTRELYASCVVRPAFIVQRSWSSQHPAAAHSFATREQPRISSPYHAFSD